MKSFAVGIILVIAATASMADDCRRGLEEADRLSVMLGARGVLFGDFDHDGLLDFVVKLESKDVVMLNRGGEVYEPVQDIAQDQYPISEVRDVDGDGHLDLIDRQVFNIRVFYGRGDGTFGVPVIVFSSSPETVASGDVNGDGIGDFINRQGDTLIVRTLRGTSVQELARVTRTHPNLNTVAVSAHDFDGDGRTDILWLADRRFVTMFWQEANGTFTETELTAPVNPTGFVLDLPGGAVIVSDRTDAGLQVLRLHGRVATTGMIAAPHLPFMVNVQFFDFDRDGLRDLVYASGSTAGIAWGTSAESFSEPSHYDLGAGGGDLVIADVNNDGVNDLAAPGPSGVTAAHGRIGSRDLDAPRVSLVGFGSFGGVLADLNRDGTPDLLLRGNDGNVGMAFGDGHGGFTRGPTRNFGPQRVEGLAAADVDGDGRIDVAATSQGTTRIVFGEDTPGFGASNSIVLPSMSLVGAEHAGDFAPAKLIVKGGSDLFEVTISSGRAVTNTKIATIIDGPYITMSSTGEIITPGGVLAHGPAGWSIVAQGYYPEGGTAVGADFNGDGTRDVAAVDDVYAKVFLGEHAAASTWFTTVAGDTRTVLSTDFDHDGIDDLIFVTSAWLYVGVAEIARGRGDGTFEPYSSAMSTPGLQAFAFDADGDGWTDVVTLTADGILTQHNVCAPPRIRAARTPLHPLPGQSVRFVVQAFGSTLISIDQYRIFQDGKMVYTRGGGAPPDNGLVRLTSDPLSEGHHTFTFDFTDQYASPSSLVVPVDVSAPVPRRHAAH